MFMGPMPGLIPIESQIRLRHYVVKGGSGNSSVHLSISFAIPTGRHLYPIRYSWIMSELQIYA